MISNDLLNWIVFLPSFCLNCAVACNRSVVRRTKLPYILSIVVRCRHCISKYLIAFQCVFRVLFYCNFHISPIEYIKLQRNSEKYVLLKDDPTTNTDREDFVYTKKALEVIGLDSDEILSIFKMVSIILKLGKPACLIDLVLSTSSNCRLICISIGNLIFIPTTNIDGSGGCEITNDYGKYQSNVPFNHQLGN